MNGGRVAHGSELLQDRLNAAGPDEKNAVGEPADDVLRELLTGEQFLGKDRVLGLHEANAAVQLDGDAGFGVHWNCSGSREIDNLFSRDPVGERGRNAARGNGRAPLPGRG
jgi:hypothetical protein